MKKNATFAIIGAMDSEVRTLRGKLTDTVVTEYAGLKFCSGTFGTRRVVLVRSGVGKVNAARCTQILIDRFSPDYIVNTGIAGGVGEGLHVGDIVIGSELVQHDFDVTAFGHARGYLCTGEDDSVPTVFRADEALTEAFRRAAAAVIAPSRVRTGRIATGDVFVSGAEAKRAIASLFGADAAEMEGCAIAQTAAYSGVPFIVIRALSDLADGSAPESFDEFEQQTADLSAAILERLLLEP